MTLNTHSLSLNSSRFGDNHFVKIKSGKNKTMLHTHILERTIEGVSPEEVDAHFSLLPERYFINTTTHEIELHLRMVNQLLTQIQQAESVGTLAPIIDWRNDSDLNMTVVSVVTWDRAGLFYKLAGALTLAGVNIVSTKAISRTDHITIDTFYIMEPQGGIISDKQAEGIFRTHIENCLVHGKRLTAAVENMEANFMAQQQKGSHMPPAHFPSNVEFYHELSRKRTIIEVQASDRIGLLYRIARLIYGNGFDITFARIATERGVAMDTFYIENINPRAEIDTHNLLELREKLTAIVRA
ncbi:MAG: [protein-PII] uridylyltransferase [Lentimonas sp.]|jgi:[protein-PII] uridylyltransferase